MQLDPSMMPNVASDIAEPPGQQSVSHEQYVDNPLAYCPQCHGTGTVEAESWSGSNKRKRCWMCNGNGHNATRTG